MVRWPFTASYRQAKFRIYKRYISIRFLYSAERVGIRVMLGHDLSSGPLNMIVIL